MPTVEFLIKNKSYNIVCEAGQEDKIRELAIQLNNRVEGVSKNFLSASDSLVMAISALMMEEEIRSLKESKNSLDSHHQHQLQVTQPQTPSISEEEIEERVNKALLELIQPIAEQIETLANSLEKR